MNATEFAKLAMAIRTYYPRENILPTPESMEIWYRETSDIPYELAEIAVREWYISTNGVRLSLILENKLHACKLGNLMIGEMVGDNYKWQFGVMAAIERWKH